MFTVRKNTKEFKSWYKIPGSPVGCVWGYRILHLSRGVTPSNNCPGYDTKHSNVETSVLKLWGMWNTPSLPLLPGPLLLRVVVTVWTPSIGQVELFNHLL